MRWSCGSRTHVSFPLIKLAKKLKVLGAVAMEELKGFLFPLIKLAKKLKVDLINLSIPAVLESFH